MEVMEITKQNSRSKLHTIGNYKIFHALSVNVIVAILYQI